MDSRKVHLFIQTLLTSPFHSARLGLGLAQLTTSSLQLKPGWHLELAQPSTSTLLLKTRLALGLGPAFNFITSIPCSGGVCVPRAIHFPSFLWDNQVSGTEDLIQLINFLQWPMGPLFLITAAAVSSFTGGTVASGPGQRGLCLQTQ